MNESLSKISGKVLKELRNEVGISQENLAYESDLDRSFISMMERGLRLPTIGTLFQLSPNLKTTPSEILKKIEEKLQKLK